MDVSAFSANLDRAMLLQARRAIRTLLARPSARAPGLAEVRELLVMGAAGPMRARLFRPEGAEGMPLMLFFHGGGFVIGDIDTHDSICSWLAKASGFQVVAIGYRLAPETPFPGQIEDAMAACVWGMNAASALGAAPDTLALGGDSAGAYMAMTTAITLNKIRPGSVRLQTLLYPLVHIQDSLWATEEVRNFRFIGRLAVNYIAAKLGAQDFPSLCDLDVQHAPTTIIAGGGPLDPVRADVKTLAGVLQNAGVRVVERKYPALSHGGLNFTSFSRTATTALTEAGVAMRAEWLAR